jgi:hypothetical protein
LCIFDPTNKQIEIMKKDLQEFGIALIFMAIAAAAVVVILLNF